MFVSVIYIAIACCFVRSLCCVLARFLPKRVQYEIVEWADSTIIFTGINFVLLNTIETN